MSAIDMSCQKLVAELKRQSKSIVFAESCTAGLISASIARIPGASKVLAGSLVVYQTASKIQWLGIADQTLQENDVVSPAICVAMAENALRKTPHADVAASITGHLGPGAPDHLDGVAFCGFAQWSGKDVQTDSVRLQLDVPPCPESPVAIRMARQVLAVQQVCDDVRERLASAT